MTTCTIGEPCVSGVMQLIEADPEPFILEPERIVCEGKLCEAVTDPGPVQGPPIEYLIGREELLAFMFSNQFPPITDPAVIPLPASAWLLIAALGVLGAIRSIR